MGNRKGKQERELTDAEKVAAAKGIHRLCRAITRLMREHRAGRISDAFCNRQFFVLGRDNGLFK